jgi:protein-tyrosine phosphatase
VTNRSSGEIIGANNARSQSRFTVGCGDEYQTDVCLWEPIRDAPPAPSIEWLRRIVEFIEAQRQAGLTVYVHCVAGISRSGMVATAYLMYEHGWSRDEALAFVRSRRPEIRPNPAFMPLLMEWEQALKEPAATEGG